MVKRTKKSIEFDKKQNEKRSELIDKIFDKSEPETQLEKDIFNLKYMRYSIRYGSWEFRRGMIKTLDRAIKMMERANQKKGE